MLALGKTLAAILRLSGRCVSLIDSTSSLVPKSTRISSPARARAHAQLRAITSSLRLCVSALACGSSPNCLAGVRRVHELIAMRLKLTLPAAVDGFEDEVAIPAVALEPRSVQFNPLVRRAELLSLTPRRFARPLDARNQFRHVNLLRIEPERASSPLSMSIRHRCPSCRRRTAT